MWDLNPQSPAHKTSALTNYANRALVAITLVFLKSEILELLQGNTFSILQ